MVWQIVVANSLKHQGKIFVDARFDRGQIYLQTPARGLGTHERE